MTWEETFASWGKPPGVTEQGKCDNALTIVRKAVEASTKLKNHSTTVFAQGSYRNRTNVCADSDVDICVLCTDICWADYSMSDGLTDSDVGLVDASYTNKEFRNDVGDALRSYIGQESVHRGTKAFNIRENSYRIDADVVACFEYRRYHRNNDNAFYHHSGTSLIPDKSLRIVNWPEQNYENGVSKNAETNKRFKTVVRILKNMRNYMDEQGVEAVKVIPSYLIECLVWNVPNHGFGHDTLTADVRWTLAHIFNSTRIFEDCKEWGEVNELKYLFRITQPWTWEQAHHFSSALWDFSGFE